jgi:hypothetical protein
MRDDRPLLLVFVAVAAGLCFVAVASPAAAQSSPGEGEIAVTLDPADGEAANGSVATYNVTIVAPDAGVRAYEFNISVQDTAVGEIAGFTPTNEPDFPETRLTADNSTLVVSADLGRSAYDNASEVTLGTLAVEATGAVGNTTSVTIAADNESVADNSANVSFYDVVGTQNATLSVTLPPVVGTAPPRDSNNDGRYEDVRGDGTVDIFDVQTLFGNLDNPAVQNNAARFNFQGESADEVTVFDVQALFADL